MSFEMILKIFVRIKNEQMTLYLLASIKMFKCLFAILTSENNFHYITYTCQTLFAMNTSNTLNKNCLPSCSWYSVFMNP